MRKGGIKMKKAKNIIVWIVVGFLFILACATSIIGFIFGIIAVGLIVPISKWQEFLAKFLKKPIKIIAIILAIVLMFAFVPSVPEKSSSNTSSGTGSSSTQIDDDSDAEEKNEVSNISSDKGNASEESNVSFEDGISSNENLSSETSKPLQDDASSTTSNTSSTNSTSSTETHTHKFTAATCTLPEKCSCGETKGAAKGHTWNNATCTKAKTCTVCGTTEGSAKGHNFSSGKCTICGSKDSSYTPPATNAITYVLNTKSKKFHLLSCNWLPDENREDTTKSREELVEEGYTPCGHCAR